VLTEPGGHGVDPDLVRLYLRELSRKLPPLLPDRAYVRRWLDICARIKPTGAAIFDVQIATVCLGNRVDELWTLDRRFPQVEGLTVVTL
jgi:predicted nucleic acid-binding protein